MVGGDFYWIKKLIHGYVIAVGDCTGHGVPGALMTMAANSILNYIVNETNSQNPALILKSFNRAFKATINKKDSLKIVNEGLVLGICYFDQDKLIYAGAKTALYIKGLQGLKVIFGDGKGVGYKHVDDDYDFRNIIFLSMVDLLKLDCSGHKYLPDNIYHTFTCSSLTLLEFVCAMPMTFIIRYLGVTFHGNMFVSANSKRPKVDGIA
jgi:hypothetical protein